MSKMELKLLLVQLNEYGRTEKYDVDSEFAETLNVMVAFIEDSIIHAN